MSESKAHQQAKAAAAGKTGRTEKPLKGGGRLDAATKTKAVEVERSGNQSALEKAASRLAKSGLPQKVLQVPQKDMDKAVEAMRSKGVSGTVKNMGETKTKRVN